MTTEEMLATKRIGLEKHLLSECSQKLFVAKRHLEDSSKGEFKDFQREIEKARNAIDDAEQLWKETYKI